MNLDALVIIAVNLLSVVFAAGILYSKVDGLSSRLVRVERIVDSILLRSQIKELNDR